MSSLRWNAELRQPWPDAPGGRGFPGRGAAIHWPALLWQPSAWRKQSKKLIMAPGVAPESLSRNCVPF